MTANPKEETIVKHFCKSAAIALAATLITGGAYADGVSDFYSGKTVTVLSPSGTGGSIYQYALLVSRHLGDFIPGHPTVVVEDRGGGGGVKAASYMANAAPQDGLAVAELHPSSLLVPLTQDVGFDFSKVQWLGSVAVRPYVGVVWNTVEADTLEKMKDTPVVFGASGVASSSYQIPTFMAYLSSAKLSVIPGYKSGGDTNLAMERGEVQGRGNYYEGFLATNPDWIKDKKVKFVFQIGGGDIPELKDVPKAKDYAKSDEDKKMYGLIAAPLDVGQAFYVSANVPKDRADALRAAFQEMLKDQAFLDEAKKLGLVVRPLSGEQVTQTVNDVYQTPKETADKLGKILAR